MKYTAANPSTLSRRFLLERWSMQTSYLGILQYSVQHPSAATSVELMHGNENSGIEHETERMPRALRFAQNDT